MTPKQVPVHCRSGRRFLQEIRVSEIEIDGGNQRHLSETAIDWKNKDFPKLQPIGKNQRNYPELAECKKNTADVAGFNDISGQMRFPRQARPKLRVSMASLKQNDFPGKCGRR